MPVQTAVVLKNSNPLGDGFYELRMNCHDIADNAKPGQFIMVDTGANHVPYIKRPFAIATHDSDSGDFTIVIKIAGKGTKLLSEMEPNREITVVGPLGNGFDMPSKDEKVIMVAGGVGIAALMSILDELAGSAKVDLVLGARDEKGLILRDRLREMGAELHISTEDGSVGYKGFPTPVVKDLIEKNKYDKAYVCGPEVMMKAVSEEIIKGDIPCEVSMERRMGCGIGVCVGCSCKLKAEDGSIIQKRVCKEGPVFKAEEVAWNG